MRRALPLCLILAACTGRTIPFDIIDDQPDAGDSSRDGGTSTNPQRDGGIVITPVRDAGFIRDAGSTPVCGNGICEPPVEDFRNCVADCPPPGPCPDGTEGCACNSTWLEGQRFFPQDDCDPGLECLPWDLLTFDIGQLTGPVQSCVRQCASDAECGAGRRCAPSAIFEQVPGFGGRICVDDVVGPDQWCGGSRLTTPRIPGVPIRTGNRMVGCQGLAQCVTGVADAHPDEGVCLQLCNRPNDPPCQAPTPYCNPNLFGDGVGVCSVARLGVGAWCAFSQDPDDPSLTTLCDNSDATPGEVVCVGLGISRGLCLELCDTTANPPSQPCQNADPNLGPHYCVDGLLQNGGGICFTPDCNVFPDTCQAPGSEGLGQFCLVLTQESDGICVDHLGPPYQAGSVDTMGNLQQMGDNCQDPSDDLAFAKCPDGTTCLGNQAGGSCLAGCSRDDPMSAQYCSSLLMSLGVPSMNAVCADVPPFMDPSVGLCGGE